MTKWINNIDALKCIIDNISAILHAYNLKLVHVYSWRDKPLWRIYSTLNMASALIVGVMHAKATHLRHHLVHARI